MPLLSLPASALSLARAIDHTLLRPDAGQGDIARLCEEAIEYSFASVCVHPYWVPLAASRLRDSSVAVCTVVGFPLGANPTRIKVAEAHQSAAQGATEIDMVLNIGELCGDNFEAVSVDMCSVIAAARDAGAITKVILETAYLTDERKRTACEIARDAGAASVKTSTGFAGSGATVDDVALLRASVPASMGVKAAGGIRSLATTREMLAAGANRIGTSSGINIIQSALSENGAKGAAAR